MCSTLKYTPAVRFSRARVEPQKLDIVLSEFAPHTESYCETHYTAA